MIGPIGITLRQAEDHFDFLMDLTETQRVCWKITRPDGKSALMVPVNEVPHVSDEIQNQVEEFRKQFEIGDKPVIALLPGSRKREIKTKLPKMLKMVKHFPDHQFVVAGSDAIGEEFYQNWMAGHSKLVFGHTYDILNNAEAALVTSGTATLETALFRVPQVVCYKPGWLTFKILKRVTKIRLICMVNLILDQFDASST